MLKSVLAALLALALIAPPAMAGERKQLRPQLTAQVLDGIETAQENLIRLKVKALRVYQPRLSAPRRAPPKG